MISVAGGMALEGFRPIAHSYAPFLVERPFEQIKLDLGHQDVGAVLVSIGASYDTSAEGRTHQAPGDVALLSTLPDWTVRVPGHPDEVERLLKRALADSGRVYVRLSDEVNDAPLETPFSILRHGSTGCPLVVAVGPTLVEVLAATDDLDVTVAYTMTPRPFDGEGPRTALTGTVVVLVEPYWRARRQPRSPTPSKTGLPDSSRVGRSQRRAPAVRIRKRASPRPWSGRAGDPCGGRRVHGRCAVALRGVGTVVRPAPPTVARHISVTDNLVAR